MRDIKKFSDEESSSRAGEGKLAVRNGDAGMTLAASALEATLKDSRNR